MKWQSSSIIRERLGKERGRLDAQASYAIALAYPSPYHAGMSSLGFLHIYRLIQTSGEVRCERAFLPDDAEGEVVPLTYEGLHPLTEFPVIAMSVAYELELAGVVRLLEASGIPSLRVERTDEHPFILAGGPLTFSNPLPLGAFADAIVMGEADEIVLPVLAALRDAGSKAAALKTLSQMDHVYVPEIHEAWLPSMGKASTEMLPAHSPIRTPDTELSDMFLMEAERGCSRACTYCVMRRSTNGGMRIVPQEKLLSLVPEDAKKVGLVGAAVSDHPKISAIVRELAGHGMSVGLSSLRPDRLSDDFVGALKLAGYRTLTTAMDGPSERLRESLERKARIKHLSRAAELAREHGMKRLKLYLMVGLPTETDEDIDECAAFVSELSTRIPVALGIAPFCAKRNTPMDGAAFAGISLVEHRLARLKRGLRGRADVRSTSARWAWVEYVLAQGGIAEGAAVRDIVKQGGKFAHYKASFEALAQKAPGKRARSLAIAPF